MAKTTAHYNLTVPELNDAPDVEVLAQNFEDVDNLIYEHETTAQEYVDEQAAAMRTETTTRLNAFAASVPDLVTDAIGEDMQARVTDYLDEHGVQPTVENVTGAVGGVSAGGVTYTPDASTHVVTLPVVKSINGTITPDANGNVVLDTGAGAVKSINGTITPDANGNVVLDTGAGAVKSINGTITPDAAGNVALTAENVPGTVRSIRLGTGTFTPDSSGAVRIPGLVSAQTYSFTLSSSYATAQSEGYLYRIPVEGLLATDFAILALDESAITGFALLEQYREDMACLYDAQTEDGYLSVQASVLLNSVPLLLKVVSVG